MARYTDEDWERLRGQLKGRPASSSMLGKTFGQPGGIRIPATPKPAVVSEAPKSDGSDDLLSGSMSLTLGKM